MLDFPGSPRRTYEFLGSLWLNLERSELRKSLRVLNGVKACLAGGELGVEWFAAMFDTAEEAQAMHALHADRMRSASRGKGEHHSFG